jgi:hypothetical protein
MNAPRSLIDYGRLLEVIGIEGELMLATAASALPHAAQAEVPGCPDFTLDKTLRHVGSVHRVARLWVRDGRRPEQWQRSPADGDVVGFVRSGLDERLLAASDGSRDHRAPGRRGSCGWWAGARGRPGPSP